ncbi:replication initiator protein [Apis mellifera associated microvirus 13]|nr:replication initiator protein [Apis mellifera associated microvirus 13]
MEALMPCYHPINAYKTASGEIVFTEKARYGDTQHIKLPCGQCIGCRLERSRQWGVRCMHEAQMHKQNSFVTLTYNAENTPQRGNLNHADFQKFMKRLRKHAKTDIRYYMGGEYGPTTWRPHFHACIFGYDFADKLYFKTGESGEKIYTSKTLEKLWPYGFSTIGNVTFQSAAYIARYCVQKVTGQAAEEHYKRVDDQGEYQLTPEYNRMSLKPAIGKTWLEKYRSDVYNHDHVIINGVKSTPPKYYDKLLKRWDANRLEELKEQREANAQTHKEDQTWQRLEAKEQFQHARIKSLLRNKI